MKIRHLAALAAVALSGCSTVMEANRPDPVDLSRYSIGDKRVDVISRLGVPATNVKNGELSCDVYSLYTKGVSKVGKGAIILGEAAADVLTLGLAEVVATPGEAVTKNKKHTVLFCYNPDDTVAFVTDDGKAITVEVPPSTTSADIAAAKATPTKP